MPPLGFLNLSFLLGKLEWRGLETFGEQHTSLAAPIKPLSEFRTHVGWGGEDSGHNVWEDGQRSRFLETRGGGKRALNERQLCVTAVGAVAATTELPAGGGVAKGGSTQ